LGIVFTSVDVDESLFVKENMKKAPHLSVDRRGAVRSKEPYSPRQDPFTPSGDLLSLEKAL
jgi:hypothetical protein